jgi:hypothetical protein
VMTLLSHTGDGASESVLAVSCQGTATDRQGAVVDRQGATADCQHINADHQGASSTVRVPPPTAIKMSLILQRQG